MSEDASSTVAEATESTASSPEVVATETQPSTTTPSEPTQRDQESIDRDFFKKNPGEGQAKPTEDGEIEDVAAEAEEAPPAATTPKIDGYEGITEPQAQVLKRLKVSPSVWGKLDTEERTELLASFEQHVRYTSQLAQENAGFKRQGQANQANPAEAAAATQAAAPPANTQQAPPLAQANGDHWSAFKEYGDDFSKGLQSAFQAELSPVTERFNQQQTLLQDLGQRLINDDIEAAFNDLALPDGVDSSNPEIRKAIVNAAWAQFGPDLNGFSIAGRSMKSAIQTAASTLFQKQAKQAEEAAKKTRVQSHLRASPTRQTAATATAKIELSQEEVDRIALKAISQGGRDADVRKEIERAGRR